MQIVVEFTKCKLKTKHKNNIQNSRTIYECAYIFSPLYLNSLDSVHIYTLI